MPAIVHIVVPGAIVPWRRAQRRQFKNGGVATFTHPDVEAYHATVRMAAAAVMGETPPMDCPLEMSLLAVFEVPNSWSGKKRREALLGMVAKTTRPDLENSLKGAQDSMQSIVYKDDSQIVVYRNCSKVYGDRPRLEITLTPIIRGERVVDEQPASRSMEQPMAEAGPLFAAAG